MSVMENNGAEQKPQENTVAKKPTPVKKKKIIIVTNNGQGRQGSGYVSGNGRTGGTRTSAQGGKREKSERGERAGQESRANRGGVTGAYHPIKPKTAPSQVDSDIRKAIPVTTGAPAKAEVKKETAKAEASVQEKAAEVQSVAKEAAPVQAVPKAEASPKAESAAANEAAKPAAKAAPKAEEKLAEEKPQEKQRPTHYDLSNPNLYRRPSSQNRNNAGGNNNGAGRGERTGFGGRGGAGGNAGGRGDRSQGGRFGQDQNRFGGRGGAGNNAGGRGERSQGGYGQGGRGGQGAPQGQGRGGRNGGRSFGGDNSEGATIGNENNKRRMNQAKDKRNKKDVAFAQDEQRERKNRSGRFIKPVVEVKAEPEEQIKVISIPEKLTLRDLAEKMHIQASEIIKKLFLAGKIMTVNSEVTYEEAENIAADYEILCEKEEKVDVIEELLKEDEEKEEDLVERAPVICVMGHVDHGKTSLLDYIRKTNVTGKEAGGITQAIGAYTVKVGERTITFLDTPGHEAFTAMRLRGAQSTDIAVLVVAADDGVMPQTVEAINHARAAGVEIIVAVNKIDKPTANPDRIKEQLSKYELIPTEWGGSTEFVNVSAKSGEGIEDLLETILLQADVMELKANPNRLARGLVLEARLDKGRGPVANVLIQKGTLRVGNFISAGAASGKVRALINDKGQNVKEAGPSTPVMVLGLSDVPSAGEVIVAHASNDEAKSYAQTYKAQHKEELLEENRMSMNVEDLFDQMREGKMKELELIVKADVQGSVEALCASLLKLSNDEVIVRIIHSAVGNITESDVTLAAASNAAIIGFNVHPDATAKSIAEHDGVSIHLYKVIYEAIDDVDAALKGMLAPVYEEKVIGHAEIRQIFKSGKIGNISGSYVLDGQIERGCNVRITRGKDQIFEGALASLKRFKDDVKEVKAGYECGLVFEDFDAVNVGDQVEAYKMVEVPREQVIAQKEAAKAKQAKAQGAQN